MTQRITKDLLELEGPSFTNPGEKMNYFLFKKSEGDYDDDSGCDVTVRVTQSYSQVSNLLPASRNMHSTHASDQRGRVVAEQVFPGVRDAISGKKLMTLQACVQGYDGHVRKHGQSPKSLASSGLLRGALQGRAADEYDVVVEEAAADARGPTDLSVDLTDDQVREKKSTPQKKKGGQNLGDGASSFVEDNDNSDEGECGSDSH